MMKIAGYKSISEYIQENSHSEYSSVVRSVSFFSPSKGRGPVTFL